MSVARHTNPFLSSVLSIKRNKIFLPLLLSSLKNFFHFVIHFFRRLLPIDKYLYYPIEDQIFSPATRVIFTRSKRTNQPICLKVWRKCKNELFNIQEVATKMDYLIEGLEHNRRFAHDVYLGVASVKLGSDAKRIRRGRLLKKPKKSQLKPGEQYALVMKRLDENWRLDRQLHAGKLGTKEGIEFLAKEVASIHRKLEKSPSDFGTPQRISAKLELNSRLFNKALIHLTQKHLTTIEKFRDIVGLMKYTCRNYTDRFKQRCYDGYIKHCHGDLKATNLWVRPRKSGTTETGSNELLALDCADFNPEFCHIDTLSDIAMLAIDIETRLLNTTDSKDKNYGQRLAKHFLTTYLRDIGENPSAVWPLLEYYMTEKAMICAYVSILFSNSVSLGEKYLEVALAHAQKLEKLIPLDGSKHLSSDKRETIVLR